MASYKIPQDVEADDKLIGPFSFRQFIYLIIAVLAIAIGWALGRLFIPLAIIPLPIVLLFGALALPLRKDQPMEIYLAAIISYYLKPHRRLWQPDGIQSLVQVVAPAVIDVRRTKDISQSEAEQRLSYLANIADTKGWSVRGVSGPASQSIMTDDAYNEAMGAQDILDASSGIAQSLNQRINATDTRHHEAMLAKMRSGAAAFQAPQPVPPLVQATIPPLNDLYASLPLPPTSVQGNDPHLSYNPYPADIHQSVIRPLSDQPVQPQLASPPITTSRTTISPDIINLASNSDLSIETIAHEANRIKQRDKQPLEDEVVISLH